MRRLMLICVAALALALVPAAGAGGPFMLVGAAEDVVLQHDSAFAKSRMDLAKLAGLDSIRVTAQWSRGDRQLGPNNSIDLGNAIAAAKLDGIRVLVSIYPFGSSVTPLTDAERADFAAFAADVARRFPYVHDFIVGNEPNLNRFWLPQFAEDGSDAAAPAYLALLATAYDAIKAVQPHSTIYGGALSPHGADRPEGIRPTHSPTQFLLDMGEAYRASGRQVPVMDAFAFHPYGDRSDIPPDFEHPNSTAIGIADYGKLVALLGQAFDGTAQRGSALPILYDEYGVESILPGEKTGLYTGTEPSSVHPVDEATQAAFYEQALELTFCQPTVMGLLLFHVIDEPGMPTWQSGLYYVDGTPKTSLEPVRDAVAETHRGVVADCPDLGLTPKLKLVPHAPKKGTAKATVTVSANLDSTFALRVVRVGGGAAPARALRGTVLGGQATTFTFPAKLAKGRYRFTLTATAARNAGGPATAVSRPFVVR